MWNRAILVDFGKRQVRIGSTFLLVGLMTFSGCSDGEDPVVAGDGQQVDSSGDTAKTATESLSFVQRVQQESLRIWPFHVLVQSKQKGPIEAGLEAAETRQEFKALSKEVEHLYSSIGPNDPSHSFVKKTRLAFDLMASLESLFRREDFKAAWGFVNQAAFTLSEIVVSPQFSPAQRLDVLRRIDRMYEIGKLAEAPDLIFLDPHSELGRLYLELNPEDRDELFVLLKERYRRFWNETLRDLDLSSDFSQKTAVLAGGVRDLKTLGILTQALQWNLDSELRVLVEKTMEKTRQPHEARIIYSLYASGVHYLSAKKDSVEGFDFLVEELDRLFDIDRVETFAENRSRIRLVVSWLGSMLGALQNSMRSKGIFDRTFELRNSTAYVVAMNCGGSARESVFDDARAVYHLSSLIKDLDESELSETISEFRYAIGQRLQLYQDPLLFEELLSRMSRYHSGYIGGSAEEWETYLSVLLDFVKDTERKELVLSCCS